MLREATRDLGRLKTISRIVAKYGYDEFIRRSPFVDSAGRESEDLRWPARRGTSSADNAPGVVLPESGPRRFRLMLEELGPTFIKLGQLLSTRPDLMSPAYTEELKKLQYQCEPLPFEDIIKAIETGLRDDPRRLFPHICEVPLATASIAQVHRGTTSEGVDVVIKVQRPGILDEIGRDIDIMYRFAKIFDKIVEESKLAEPVGIVREFERSLEQELNFRNETSNLIEFKKLHEGRQDIVIPTVYSQLSSATVLTMECLDGAPFSQLPEGSDKKAIAHRIVKEAFDEVFIDGVFHGDPHPGNLMLLKDGRYAILDLGLIGRLTPGMRETLVVLALAIAVRDAETVARTLYRLGQNDERVSLAAVRDDTALLFGRYLDRSIKDVDATQLLSDLLFLAMKNKIRVPAEYTMLARAGGIIEGIVREFDPDIDIAGVAAPYAERLLIDRVSPSNMQGGVYKALLHFQGLSQDLPMQISQILSDLASGNFMVNVTGRSVDRLTATLLVSATMIAGSILAAGFVVGTFLTLGGERWRLFGIPVTAIVGACCAGMLIFWLSVYAAVRPRLKKISVLRFFKKKRSDSTK